MAEASRNAPPPTIEEAPSRQSTRAACFVVAHLLSAFGFEFLVFILTVHVHDLTGSAWNVGVFTALTFVPRLLAPYYGSLVDRLRRERLFGGAAVAIAAAVLAIASVRSMVLTYATWLVLAVLAMIIATVRTAIMTELIPGQGYLRGNSIMLVSLNAAKLLAPMLGGVVVLRWSTPRAMYATAGVYLAAAVLGLVTRLAPVPARPRSSATEVVSHLREGFRYVLSSRDLRYLGTVAVLWRLTLALQVPLFVVYVKDTLGRGSAGYGLFMAAIGVGSLAGSVLGPHLGARLHPRRIAFWGLAAHCASFSLLGWTRSFALAVSVAVMSYVLFYAAVVSVHALRDGATEAAYRGRVNGIISGLLTPAALVSILAGSALASAVGAPAVLAGGGLLGLTGLILVHLRFFARRRGRPGSAPPARPAPTSAQR